MYCCFQPLSEEENMRDWTGDCLILTGYEANIVQRMAHKLRTVNDKITDVDVFVTFFLLHLNLEQHALAILMNPRREAHERWIRSALSHRDL